MYGYFVITTKNNDLLGVHLNGNGFAYQCIGNRVVSAIHTDGRPLVYLILCHLKASYQGINETRSAASSSILLIVEGLPLYELIFS